MAARVFISCAQASDEEQLLAREVAEWLRQQGFIPYVAITAQTITDLNSGIIHALRESDYYLFIDFPRESMPDGIHFRGSLYTHQELAAAYVLGFDRMILISHELVQSEGMKQFIISNSPRFNTADQVPRLVREAVSASNWTPNFSRHLSVPTARLGDCVRFFDHTTPSEGRVCRVLYVDVQNNRTDIAALHTLCRLARIEILEGNPTITPDTTILKATGRSGFEHTIWPESHVAFDALAIHQERPAEIYLHSSLDIRPKAPIVSGACQGVLHYEVIAEGFSILLFKVQFRLTDDPDAMTWQIG